MTFSLWKRVCPYKEFVGIIGLKKLQGVYFSSMVCMNIRVLAEVLLTLVLQRLLIMRLRIKSNNITLLISCVIVQLI